MALPAVECLKRSAPALKLSWLVETRHRSILEGHPDLEEVLCVDTFRLRRRPWSPGRWRELAKTVSALRGRHFDAVVDLQGLTKSAVLARLAAGRRRLGLPRAAVRELAAAWLMDPGEGRSPDRRHVSEQYARVLERLRGAASPSLVGHLREPRLPLTDGERERVRTRLSASGLRSFVVLNPGGGWVTKLWPAKRYLALGRWLLEQTKLGIFVSWGPGEEALAQRLLDGWESGRAVSYPTSVREFAALVAEARLFVGSDTGPYHIARAMGTPTLGLFGPTDPGRNGPLNGHGDVLWEKVPCSPCHVRDCPTAIECMDRLDVDRVIERVSALVETSDMGS
jgi:lipopolysaccharide heptosyltransferase I